MKAFHNTRCLWLAPLLLALSACNVFDDDDDDPVPPPPPPPVLTATFDIDVTNLSAGQPFSPPAVIIHRRGYQAFTLGQPASVALENLAEGGSPTMLLTEAAANSAHIASRAGPDLVMPGMTGRYQFEITQAALTDARLTVLTMPVNSNDAIAGLQAVDISTLAVGQSRRWFGLSYDAGTEANSETAASIPGPAAGGEGFNASRDDIADRVLLHGGVVTNADGLASSVLGQQHRWDNPMLQLTVTRRQ